jgi:hypothetical protein
MASPVRLYQREIHANMGYFATWLPGDPIAIGDAGVLLDGRFRKMSSLKDLGISFDIEEAGTGQDVQYTSTKGTTVTVIGGAMVPAVAQGEINVEFSQTGAFVFHATGLRLRQFRNRTAVAKSVVSAYEANHWNREWLLIEAVHTADRATIIVSEDGNAGITLTATVNGTQLGASLADPKVGLTAKAVHGRLIQILGQSTVWPLYSCLKIKYPLFGKTIMGPVRGESQAEYVNNFVRLGIDELLNS